MPSKHTARQGQAWDQAAKEHLGGEKRMHTLLPLNVAEMDTLLFAGGVELDIPDLPVQATRSLPPWERM